MTSRRGAGLWTIAALAVLVGLVFVVVVAPRETRPATTGTLVPGSEGAPGGGSSAAPVVPGASPERSSTGAARPSSPATTAAPPSPSGSIDGGGVAYFKPTPRPTREPVPDTRTAGGIRGQATWWDSFGGGLYAAIRPDLGSKGDLAIVCGGRPFRCLSIPIITTCACLGPRSHRLIDLSRDAFRAFAPPSRGVVSVLVQVVPR